MSEKIIGAIWAVIAFWVLFLTYMVGYTNHNIAITKGQAIYVQDVGYKCEVMK